MNRKFIKYGSFVVQLYYELKEAIEKNPTPTDKKSFLQDIIAPFCEYLKVR